MLHQRYDDGDIELADFEAAKSELIGQIDVS